MSAPAGMHPDAAAVYSPVWDVLAPIQWPDGRVSVSLISKRMDEDVNADAERADEIARALVTGAVLDRTARTVFNKQAVRRYSGTALTALARRREGETLHGVPVSYVMD